MEEGLDIFGESDTASGRRRFVERLDGFIGEEGSDPQIGDVPLTQLFGRGWYWGSQEFSERLQKRLEGMAPRKSRNYRSRLAGPTRDHGERRAREIIAATEAHYDMDEAALCEDCRKDLRRASVAWALAKETSVPHAWNSEKLYLKSAANASQQIRRFHLAGKGPGEGFEGMEAVAEARITSLIVLRVSDVQARRGCYV